MRTNTKINKSALSWIANPNRSALGVALGGITLLLGAGLIAPNFATQVDSASATTTSKDLPVNVKVDPVISLKVVNPSAPATEVDNISMDVTPKGEAPDLNKASAIASVSTNNVTGYNLSLSMADGASNTSLNHTLDPNNYHIDSIIGDTATTSDDLINHWGYSTEALNSITTLKALPSIGSTIILKDIDHVPTTTAETDTPFTVATRVSTAIPSGTYSNAVKFTAVTNVVPDPTFSGITRMQDMTPEICAAETTPDPTATEATTIHTVDTDKVPTATLKDTRDNKTYTVSKLADGSCWMRDNLALELDSGTTYTKDNTDLNSTDAVRDGWKPESSTLTNLADWTNDFNHPVSIINPTGAPEKAGAYYNWSAAVASNDTSGHTTSGEKMPDSICPKGWQLPIADGTTSTETNQLAKLWTAYGWNEDTWTVSPATLFGNPLNFVLAGGVYGGSLYVVGAYGYLWSPVVRANNLSYDGRFDSDGNAGPGSSYGRDDGQSVRCVAR